MSYCRSIHAYTQTLKMCELVRVTEDDRTIIIIDYPTIRIRFEHANDHNEIEQALRKQQVSQNRFSENSKHTSMKNIHGPSPYLILISN